MDSFDVLKNLRKGYNETDIKDNQPKFNFKKENKPKKPFEFKKFIFKSILCFLLINALIFFVVIARQTIGRPYSLAKRNMSVAVVVEYVYILPLTKIFGPYNILTKPLYAVRNNFYERGYDLLPDDDAEMHLWWTIIRFNEWYFCIQPQTLEYIGRRTEIT